MFTSKDVTESYWAIRVDEQLDNAIATAQWQHGLASVASAHATYGNKVIRERHLS